MANDLIETKWGSFSEKFIAFHKLPFGSELRLFDPSGRKKRTDFLVKRQRIRAKTMHQVADTDTVRSLIDAALGAMSTNLQARGLKIEFFGPDGQKKNGNMHIRTIRQMTPKLSEEDISHIQEEEQIIAEIQSNAQAGIVEAEYLIDDPSSTVCAAYVRALVARYGRPAVIAALGR